MPYPRKAKPAQKPSAPKHDVYQVVTDKIVAAIENGAKGSEWRMPWHTSLGGDLFSLPISVAGSPYRGTNIIVLWVTALQNGYTSNVWGTFQAYKKLGAYVRKGEKGTMVVYYNFIKKENKETGEEDIIPIAGYRFVYNADQVENYKAPTVETPTGIDNKIENCELFFNALPIKVVHGGNKACYIPSADYCKMPEFKQFFSPEDYYATRGHESVHASGHKDRCNRDMSGKWGSEAYAGEELVAELGSAFLCCMLGIANEPRPDHAQYMAGWLQKLKDDKRAIFNASTKAQEAVDWLVKAAKGQGVANTEDEGEEDEEGEVQLKMAA